MDAKERVQKIKSKIGTMIDDVEDAFKFVRQTNEMRSRRDNAQFAKSNHKNFLKINQ